MKKILSVIAVAACFAFTTNIGEINIGDSLPMANEKLDDFNGKSHTLADLNGENGLIMIFSCNTCPFVIASEEEYPKINSWAAEKGFNTVLINSNEAKREKDDSPSEMKKHSAEANYVSTYLIDTNHKIADAIGAKTTPHVFVFDKDLKLIYKGAIDDRFENKNKEVKTTYLKNAIDEYSAGKTISTPITKERGCSIKRVKS